MTSNSNAQSSIDPHPFKVLGFAIHLLPDYVDWLSTRIAQHQGTHVVTLNAEMTMQAEQDLALADIIHRANLVVPDGSGIVLYLKLHGKTVRRCPGIELTETLLQTSARQPQPWSVFFYGGAPGVAAEAAEKLRDRFPRINIVGTQNGFLSEADTPLFLDRLRDLQPQIICVGLGVPRQEYWIAKHRHVAPNAVWIGVGGSFDIWADRKQRAPAWFCDNHLEWMYRLYQEPWRWRRMLALPQFAWRSILEKFRH
ncbi:WecB/TagA/CpsF family glycosyltransferase [Altericista sp. CCNU0014]|uniref:WecB/TagA/CpsF family glycosyltransferase n=1 Tax=Altericista sp. CCNU0014 TaxID=3082949 RepID=UPI00384C21D2